MNLDVDLVNGKSIYGITIYDISNYFIAIGEKQVKTHLFMQTTSQKPTTPLYHKVKLFPHSAILTVLSFMKATNEGENRYQGKGGRTIENINDNMSEKQKAKTVRLAGYDYRQPGAYAITICTRKRRWLFQHPVLRAILYKEWENLPQHYVGIVPDVMIVMHNHIHCILIIESNQPEVKSVIEIIGGYKSIVSNAWYAYVKECNGHYPMKLWQKRFYDHIIRDQRDFDAQTAYILNNPAAFKAKRKKKNLRKKSKRI